MNQRFGGYSLQLSAGDKVDESREKCLLFDVKISNGEIIWDVNIDRSKTFLSTTKHDVIIHSLSVLKSLTLKFKCLKVV